MGGFLCAFHGRQLECACVWSASLQQGRVCGCQAGRSGQLGAVGVAVADDLWPGLLCRRDDAVCCCPLRCRPVWHHLPPLLSARSTSRPRSPAGSSRWAPAQTEADTTPTLTRSSVVVTVLSPSTSTSQAAPPPQRASCTVSSSSRKRLPAPKVFPPGTANKAKAL